MSNESAPLLAFANLINGSVTDKVSELTVVVVPLTVKLPEIVTSSGNPIVTVAVSLPDPDTSTSLVVPAIVAT